MIRLKVKELLLNHESFYKTGKPKELKEVCEELGISKFTMGRLANGCENIGSKHIEKLMKFFGLENHEISKLVEFYDLKKKPKKKANRKLLGMF